MTSVLPKLPFNLMAEICSVIQDTGFFGSAEEYVQKFYSKPFEELTICEAEMIVRTLGNKLGCLCEPFIKKEEGMAEGKKIIIDKELCMGCGICEETCPDVFGLDPDKGISFVRPEAKLKCLSLQEAIDNCPVGAITEKKERHHDKNQE